MDEKEEKKEWYRDSKDQGGKFFDRWSILSAGTFTLLIPFIQSLENYIKGIHLLIVIEILLVISLLTSTVHSWVASQISFYNAYPDSVKNIKFYTTFQRFNYPISIFSYMIAIILIIIFININILNVL